MKTLIIIFNGVHEPMYGMIEGDYSNLDGTAINAGKDAVKEQDAIDLIYDEDGCEKPFLSTDKTLLTSKEWDDVVTIYILG